MLPIGRAYRFSHLWMLGPRCAESRSPVLSPGSKEPRRETGPRPWVTPCGALRISVDGPAAMGHPLRGFAYIGLCPLVWISDYDQHCLCLVGVRTALKSKDSVPDLFLWDEPVLAIRRRTPPGFAVNLHAGDGPLSNGQRRYPMKPDEQYAGALSSTVVEESIGRAPGNGARLEIQVCEQPSAVTSSIARYRCRRCWRKHSTSRS